MSQIRDGAVVIILRLWSGGPRILVSILGGGERFLSAAWLADPLWSRPSHLCYTNTTIYKVTQNTNVMQQDADFITADFLYMFRASCAHHQECKILTRQPPVQVVMVVGGSSLRHIRDETVLLQTFSTCFGRHAPIIRSVKY